MQFTLDYCDEHELMFQIKKTYAHKYPNGIDTAWYYKTLVFDYIYIFVWQCMKCKETFPMTKEEVIANKDQIEKYMGIDINKVLEPKHFLTCYGGNPSTKEEDLTTDEKELMSILYYDEDWVKKYVTK